MCAPDMPEPPDPYKTASAQTGQNVSTAIANAFLGNVGQNTPYGSLSYNQSGTYQFTDPNSGAVYDIPQFTATQTFSPDQQKLFDTGMGVKQNLADLAFGQSARLNDLLSSPFDLSGLPARNDYTSLPGYNVQAPTLGYGPQLATGQNLNAGYASGGSIASAFGQTKNQIPIGMPATPSFGGMGTIQSALKEPVGKINASFEGGGGLQSSISGLDDITKTYGTDFSEDRQRVEDAWMARINPQLERDRERLRTEMVNSGVQAGSSVYGDEMDTWGRQANDARNQAVIMGGQEQSRLVGMERDRSIFQNAAQDQGYQQKMGQARLANEASSLGFQQAQARAMYELAAQGQGFGQQMAQAGLNNSAIAQDFQQRMGQGQLGQNAYALALQAQGQEFGQLLSRAQLQNSAQAQAFGQNRANIDASNAVLQQMTQSGNYAALTEYLNRTQAQQGNFDNALRDFTTNYSTSMSTANAQNAARAQALQEAFAIRNQPINEVSALMGGAQVQSPSFVNTSMPQIPTVDQAGLIQQDYQNRYAQAMAQYQAQQGMLGGILGIGAAFAGNPSFALSDRRTKKDIKKVGNLYEFSYIGEPKGKKHVGVMAQEVERFRPGVVATGRDGLKRVNYSALFDLAEAA